MMTDDLSQEPKLDLPASAAHHMSKLAKLKVGESEEEPTDDDNEVSTTEAMETQPTPSPTINKPSPPPAESTSAEKSAIKPPPVPKPPPQDMPKPISVEKISLKAEKPPAAEKLPSPVTEKSTPTESSSNKVLPKPEPEENLAGDKTSPLKKEEQLRQPDTYNGSSLDNYSWSQTMCDIDIKVPAPKCTTGKDIKVEIKADYLKVELVRPTRRVSTYMYMYMYTYVCNCVCFTSINFTCAYLRNTYMGMRNFMDLLNSQFCLQKWRLNIDTLLKRTSFPTVAPPVNPPPLE